MSNRDDHFAAPQVRVDQKNWYTQALQEQRQEAVVLPIPVWFRQQSGAATQDYLWKDNYADKSADSIATGGIVPMPHSSLLDFVQAWVSCQGQLLTPLREDTDGGYNVGFTNEAHEWHYITREVFGAARSALKVDDQLHSKLQDLLSQISANLIVEDFMLELCHNSRYASLFLTDETNVTPEEYKAYRESLLPEAPDAPQDIKTERAGILFKEGRRSLPSDEELRALLKTRAEQIKKAFPDSYNDGRLPETDGVVPGSCLTFTASSTETNLPPPAWVPKENG